MPCETLRTTQVDLGKVDPGHLAAALNALGLNAVQSGTFIRFSGGNYSAATGQLTLSGSLSAEEIQKRTNEIRQAYSGQVVKFQAKKFGWGVKQIGANKYEVTKRTL